MYNRCAFLYNIFEENGEKKIRIITRFYKECGRVFHRVCFANMEPEFSEKLVIPVAELLKYKEPVKENNWMNMTYYIDDKSRDVAGGWHRKAVKSRTDGKRVRPTIWNEKLSYEEAYERITKDVRKYGKLSDIRILQFRYIDESIPCGTYIYDGDQADLITKEEAEKILNDRVSKEFGQAINHFAHMMTHHAIGCFNNFRIIDEGVDTTDFVRAKQKEMFNEVRDGIYKLLGMVFDVDKIDKSE